MKTKLLLSILLFGTLTFSNAQEKKYQLKSRPADYEYLSAPDSLGIRHPLLMPNLAKRVTQAVASLPYPIIFIHGLNSNDLIWGNSDTNANLMHNKLLSFGLSFGGRFDFNLNYDGNNTIANKLFYPNQNADIAYYQSSAIAGDYYFVNFDIGGDGSNHPPYSNLYFPYSANPNNVRSNQSAIAKQGKALQIVIKYVMELTSRDKVILMGHSMGGLASREYLQNPENWKEPYINHHVAKLVTTGAPHGGSNASMSFLGTIFKGIDNKSEAVRDLRRTYIYSGLDGVFLKGGLESNSVMYDIRDLLFNQVPFYNVDVNCNGVIGEPIIGLNNNNIPTDLDYACIIGTGGYEPNSDGVVLNSSANLTNIYPTLSVNKFYYTNLTALIEVHTELPSQIYQNMQGLDEPNEYYLAYGIEFGKTYEGFTTVQPDGGYPDDFDDFTFNVITTSQVNVSIGNVALANLMAHIVDINGNSYGVVSSNGTNSISFSQTLPTGKYYLEIYGTATTTSYLSPYTFTLTNTLSTDNFELSNPLVIYPNPTKSEVSFDNSTFNFEKVSIANSLGQEVSKSSFSSFISNQEVDMSKLPVGIYMLKLSNQKGTKTVKVIKE